MRILNIKSLKTLSLNEIGLWLLIPLASLSSHTLLPIPPTMLLLLGAMVVWTIQNIKKQEEIKIENAQKEFRHGMAIFTFFCIYLFVSQYFTNAAFRHYMGAVLAPLYLVLILIFVQKTSSDFLKKLGSKFIRYSLVILSIEAILRYIFCIFYIIRDKSGVQEIYQFKFNGPMYLTSNAVAAHLVVLLFFVFWWSQTHSRSMKKEIFLILMLIVLTLSRASLVAIACGLAYYLLFRNLNWKKSLLFCLVVGISAGLGIWSLQSFYNDESFQSKFTILNESLEYLKIADLKSILFGIGFNGSTHIMTHHAHNYFLLYLLESGVFGLIFLLATLFFLIKATSGKAMIILFPFLVQTSAESNTFLPYFYVAMALMLVFEHNRTAHTSQQLS